MELAKIVHNADKLRERLAGGLVAATPVPFGCDGRFDGAAHERYVRFMADQPIVGVAAWAHTGRGLLLDSPTADRVLADWRAELPEHVVIAGAGSATETEPHRATEMSVRMAESAARLGADALLAYPPTWLRGHHDAGSSVVAHHRRLAEVGLPVVLFYLYEAAGGISYSAEVLDELLSMPEVVGIKMATLDSVVTYQDVARQIGERHPEKLLITGEDRFLGYSLMRGARSALVGMGAVCCQLQADLLRAHANGDGDEFLRLSARVDELAEALFVPPMEGYIRRVLWALAHLGVIPTDAAFDPWGPELSNVDIARVGRTLDALRERG